MSDYREFEPPADLALVVARLWTYEAPSGEPEQIIVPDGHPELVIHLATPYRERGASGPKPMAVFAGQVTRPLTLTASGPVSMVAARFHPYGAGAFFQSPMDTATDRRLGLEAIDPSHADDFNPQTLRKSEPAERVQALTAYLRGRCDPGAVDEDIAAIVRAAQRGEPGDAGFPVTRRLQRRFRSKVGVSLKTLKSIFRFRAVFDRLSAGEDATWARRALEAGYFDQPQLARDFRRFLGCSAREWMRKQDGLAKALARAPS